MKLLKISVAMLFGAAFVVAGARAEPVAYSNGDYSVVVFGDLHYDGETP